MPWCILAFNVGAASGVEDVGKSGRKRQRVHDGVALPDGAHGVADFYVAAVVAGFTDQQQHAQPVFWFLLEQVHRVADCIEDGRSAVSRLQVCQVVFHQGRVAREISREIHVAVELHDRNSSCAHGEQRIEHRLQTSHARELGVGATAALDGHDQRNGLSFWRFVEARRLL